jgi:Winged helix-turn-helix DNA-binding
VSVLDDLRAMEKRVVTRLRELRPLVDEYDELRRVADRLGFDVGGTNASAKARRGTAAKAKPPRRSKRSPAKPARRSRPAAARGRSSSRSRPGGTRATGLERRARVLQLIEDQPGITVPDIAKDIGVDPPPLYRVVRKLQAEGVVSKEGKGLRLAKAGSGSKRG